MTVEEARDKRLCRVCAEPIGFTSEGMPKDYDLLFGKLCYVKDNPNFKPVTFNFGDEFAHTECLNAKQ